MLALKQRRFENVTFRRLDSGLIGVLEFVRLGRVGTPRLGRWLFRRSDCLFGRSGVALTTPSPAPSSARRLFCFHRGDFGFGNWSSFVLATRVPLGLLRRSGSFRSRLGLRRIKSLVEMNRFFGNFFYGFGVPRGNEVLNRRCRGFYFRLRLSSRLREIAILRNRFAGQDDRLVSSRWSVVLPRARFVARFGTGLRAFCRLFWRCRLRLGCRLVALIAATAASTTTTTASSPTASAIPIFLFGR